MSDRPRITRNKLTAVGISLRPVLALATFPIIGNVDTDEPTFEAASNVDADERPRIRPRTMRPQVSLRDALDDPQLLGNILVGDSWKPWRVLLLASMGEALTPDERTIFQQLTARDHEPNQRVEEFVGVIGRRGGKSRAIATLGTYIAGLCEHPSLVPGETGIVLCVAPDLEQSNIVFSYVEACFAQSPILAPLVIGKTQRTLSLSNNIEVCVRASDFRRLRGPSYVAVIGDECAFWLSEGASPDSEILNACRPGLATTGGSAFLISSPYARRGEFYRLWQQHYGSAGDPLILVAQAESRVMNPSLPQRVVDRAYERDPVAAAAEYGAKFRSDLESYISREAVMACVVSGRYELYPKPGISYIGFVDPSGGSQDSFTLAVAHNDTAHSLIVLDAIRETKPPFSPELVCAEYAALLKTYGISNISGDRYGGLWPVEQFGKYGITYDQAAAAKSQLYIDALSLINSARVALLDHPRLINQILCLERRTGSQRDVVDHAPGGRDDVANAVCGVLVAAVSKFGAYDASYAGWQPDAADTASDPVERVTAQRAQRAQALYAALQQQIFAANSPRFGRWQ